MQIYSVFTRNWCKLVSKRARAPPFELKSSFYDGFFKIFSQIGSCRVSAGVHMDAYSCNLFQNSSSTVRYLSVWKHNPTMGSKLIEITFGISRSLFYKALILFKIPKSQIRLKSPKKIF